MKWGNEVEWPRDNSFYWNCFVVEWGVDEVLTTFSFPPQFSILNLLDSLQALFRRNLLGLFHGEVNALAGKFVVDK